MEIEAGGCHPATVSFGPRPVDLIRFTSPDSLLEVAAIVVGETNLETT